MMTTTRTLDTYVKDVQRLKRTEAKILEPKKEGCPREFGSAICHSPQHEHTHTMLEKVVSTLDASTPGFKDRLHVLCAVNNLKKRTKNKKKIKRNKKKKNKNKKKAPKSFFLFKIELF